MAGDGLETGAKMLAGFEQDVSTGFEVKPGMGKTTGIVRLPAFFRQYDLSRANIQNRGPPETDFEPGLHRPRQDETAIGDLANRSRAGYPMTDLSYRRHRRIAPDRQVDVVTLATGDHLFDRLRIPEWPGNNRGKTLP